ncbi:MAG TPA: hypothetical protein VNO70_22990 [Blastocatellia bacterium]|nr:hypothetical protein [Blastocatellia bacterium]
MKSWVYNIIASVMLIGILAAGVLAQPDMRDLSDKKEKAPILVTDKKGSEKNDKEKKDDGGRRERENRRQ